MSSLDFRLTIEIDIAQLDILREKNYSLCIAKAGSSGSDPAKPTAIWSSVSDK